MEFAVNQVEVKHNETARCFEAEVHGMRAMLVYKIIPGQMLIQHTEVPPSLEGRGLAAKLTRTALEFARSKALQVVPACSYTASYMAKHPEYNDLLPPPR